MPILKDSNSEIPASGELSITLDLVDLETYSDNRSEGWIRHNLVLRNGPNELIKTSGTIHDSDVLGLENLLLNAKEGKAKSEFEPLEPDFRFTIQGLEEDELLVTCTVDYGNSLRQIYSESAIGVSYIVSPKAAYRFAEELRERRLALTKGIDFSDYEAKVVG